LFVPRVDNRRYFAPLLVALIAIAWVALFAWGESPYGRFLSHDELGDISIGPSGEGVGLALVFVGGWTLMTIAMMLPTSLPLITMFEKLVRRRANRIVLVALLLAGYIAIWTAFGAAVHTGDRAIHAAVNQVHWLEDNSYVIGAATLVLAGVYQVTPLKYMCLDKCRSPMSFITGHWSGGNERWQALKLGIHHGLFCVGCCWSLMLLMFAVGVGNIGVMLVLGAIMAVEKNMPWGRQLSAPLGVMLVVAGGALLMLGGPDACAHDIGGC
jgi:predicted metal-binding membrane protein